MQDDNYNELVKANFERFMREYDIETGVEQDTSIDNKLVDDTKVTKSNHILEFIKRLIK